MRIASLYLVEVDNLQEMLCWGPDQEVAGSPGKNLYIGNNRLRTQIVLVLGLV